MKKLLSVLVLISVSLILFSYEINETKTMSAELVSQLRDAVNSDGINDDEVMDFYYEKINPYDNRDDEEEPVDDFRDLRVAYKPIKGASFFADKALLGMLEVEIETIQDSILKNWAIQYLTDPTFDLTPTIPDDEYEYLDLDQVWAEFSDGSWDDCLKYGALINNIAFIVDMLYYYDGSDQPELENRLTELATWANELLSEVNFTPGYANAVNPYNSNCTRLWTSFHNGRIRLAGALGYAGCVLGNANFIATAENDLFERPMNNGMNGFIELMITNSGTYAEGMSYTEYTMEGLSKFFVARKRMQNGVDWFQDERIKGIYENSLDLISPNGSLIPFDDVSIASYREWDGADYGLYTAKKNFTQILPYYYNSPTSEIEIQNHIKWLNNYYRDIPGHYNYYLKGWNKNSFYAFEEGRDLNGYGTTPSKLSDGINSNEEVTILKRPVNDFSDYYDHPVLVVNHENSISRTGHEHSDQSSYIMYYKGKQLLIDPGYRPSWESYWLAKEWLQSPFAHNMIMVNPHYDSSNQEDEELEQDYWHPYIYCDDPANEFSYWNDEDTSGDDMDNPNNYSFDFREFEPIGDAASYNSDNIANPAYKNFIIQEDNINHLQVEIEYDHPQENYPSHLKNDIINIKRNFYSVDLESENPFFIIYDNVESSAPETTNEFMNQLHFALYPANNNNDYPNNPDNITTESEIQSGNGKFTYTYFDESIYLNGAFGSSNSPNYNIKDNLPQGLYYGRNWGSHMKPPQWEHKSLRINTETSGNEQFLTFLYPSEEENNPISYVENYSSGYGVKFDTDVYDDFATYIAISSTNGIPFQQEDLKFETSADFFMVKTIDQGFWKYDRLVLNKGDRFIIKDLTGTRFEDILLYDAFEEYEEVLVNWDEENNTIDVVVKTETATFPQFKIERSFGPVDYSMITVTNEYGSEHPDAEFERGTTEDAYETIHYDEDYFYVNYDSLDLPTGAKRYYTNETVNIPEGSAEVYVDQLFGKNVDLIVGANSSVIFNGTNYFGDSTRIILEGGSTLYGSGELNGSTGLWKGIKARSGSFVNLTNATIRNANYALSSIGAELNITETTIEDCNYAINLFNNSILNFVSSTVEVNDDNIGIFALSSTGEINISGSEELPSRIYGAGSGTGILFVSVEYELAIEHTDFENLEIGLSLTECNYPNITISKCDFYNNQLGIEKILSNAYIDNCNFTADASLNRVGVSLENTFEFSTRTVGGDILYNHNSIKNCLFETLKMGVRSKNSSPRLVLNQFDNCTVNINIADQSFPDLSWNARNQFSANSGTHLLFYDISSLTASIKLINGHNNFYTGIALNHDFNFLSNTTIPNGLINCNYNYWDDFTINTNGDSYLDYDPELMDEEPNDIIHISTRMDEARDLDKNGEYEAAIVQYKVILNDQLADEQKVWGECIDRVFSITGILRYDFNQLIGYYQSLIDNPPACLSQEEQNSYVKYLKDYIKKCKLVLDDKEGAKNIVQERIDDPVSEIDLLFAEMDMENIELSEAMDDTARVAVNHYSKMISNKIKLAQASKDKKWQRIYELLGLAENDDNQVVNIPVLSNNYPNPFNPSTTIDFTIPAASNVEMSIYNIKGQKVKTLINKKLKKGRHSVRWNGKNKYNRTVSSGVYFYRLNINGKSNVVKKCLLLK